MADRSPVAGVVLCEPKDETGALEAQWIEEHQPALNTDDTEHERLLMDVKRGFITDVTGPS